MVEWYVGVPLLCSVFLPPLEGWKRTVKTEIRPVLTSLLFSSLYFTLLYS